MSGFSVLVSILFLLKSIIELFCDPYCLPDQIRSQKLALISRIGDFSLEILGAIFLKLLLFIVEFGQRIQIWG